MTFGDLIEAVLGFFADVGAWVQDEPVHKALVLLLAVLSLAGFLLQAFSHLLVRRRLLSMELRHKGLIDRLTAVHGDVIDLRRQTGEFEKPIQKEDF